MHWGGKASSNKIIAKSNLKAIKKIDVQPHSSPSHGGQ